VVQFHPPQQEKQKAPERVPFLARTKNLVDIYENNGNLLNKGTFNKNKQTKGFQMIYAQESFDRTTLADRDMLWRIGDLMWRARDAVENGSEGRLKAVFECHSICRALVLEIGDGSIRYVDGELVGLEIASDLSVKWHACTHTWLETKDGSIIDPYPVGIISMAPLLVTRGGIYGPFTTTRYRPLPEVAREISNRLTWRKARVLQGLFREGKLKFPG
jgi:hypothetical protein